MSTNKAISSFEAEEALLGLILKKNQLIFEVDSLLDLSSFSSPKTASVFSAMSLMKNELSDSSSLNDIKLAEEAKLFFEQNQDKIISLIDFTNNELKSWDIKNWHDYLSYLTYKAGFVSQLDNYIKIIQEKKRLRQFNSIVFKKFNESEASTQKSEDLITNLQSELMNLSRDISLKDFVDIKNFSEEFYNKLINQTFDNRSLKIGLQSVDKVINGFAPGDFVILAARPSMGKTAFALEMAKRISKNSNVAFFSIEMPNEQLLQRLISSESGIFLNKIKNYGELHHPQKNAIDNTIDMLSDYKLWLDDTPGLRLSELVWKARKLNTIHKIDLIIIDYLQLIEINTNHDNRNQQVSEISRTLKSLARELEVPIVALSQLSRRVEQREDKRPIMSDIRESGSVEQDADLIMFLYRDGYYQKKKEVVEGNKQEEIELIISKHRNGPTGMVNLLFDPTVGKFEDKE